VRKLSYIIPGLLNLDRGISGDDTEARARSIEKASIELLENVGKLSTIIV
jgi:hypothetical protein